MTVGPFSPAVLLALGFLILLLSVCYKNYIARKYMFLCILVAAALFAFESYREVLHPSWTLTTIDVGQGDSHLVKAPSGRHFLIDAGDKAHEPEPVPTAQYVEVIGKSVRVRDKDSVLGKTLEIAHKGDLLPFLGVAPSGWYCVDIGPQEGFITNKPKYTRLV